VVILLIIFLVAFVAGYALKDLHLAIPENALGKVERLYTLHDFLLRGESLQLFNLLRTPLLLFIGTVLPLFFYVIHFGEPLVTHVLRPYFYLIITHGISLIAANLLIGPGSLIFVGVAYSVMRVFQLFYLTIKTRRKIRKVTRRLSTNPSPGSARHKLAITLYRILLLLSAVWLANSIFLVIFVILVTCGLLGIGLTYVVT